MIRTMLRATTVLSVLASSILLVGCGGGAQLGTNSSVEVTITSRDINDLELIVSPRQGAATDSGACRDNQGAFGCVRTLDTDKTTFTFTTTSEASSNPFYVYVSNQAASARTFTLEILMDGSRKVNQTLDVPAGFSVRFARIFRNSADTQ